jgi:hypothetical protein
MPTIHAVLVATAAVALPLLVNLGAGSAAAPAGKKVTGPPRPWKDMTVPQRAKYMKEVVTPKMKATFQAHDDGLFAKFGCETCHGKDAKANKFKMPSADIHSLPGTPEAFQAALKEKPSWPKWTKFMSEQVEPQMAALLGLPEFNPQKPEAGGFSCGNCHTIDKK